MSNMYAIKEETLSALGDAVRNKTLGTTEIPVLNIENKYIDYNRAYLYSFPNNNVKKVKITGFITHFSPNEVEGGYEVGNVNGTQGLGIAEGSYSEYNPSSVRADESYKVLFEGHNTEVIVPSKTVEFDEITIEGNQWAFAATKNSSSPYGLYLTYTAVGLDENGNEYKYTPLEMVDKINELEIPDIQPVVLSGSQQYGCAGAIASQFIKNFADKVSTKDIYKGNNMFSYYQNESIPFDINITNNCSSLDSIYYAAEYLKEAPNIIGPDRPIPTSAYSGNIVINGMFQYCRRIREIPYDYFWRIVPNKEYWDKRKELHSEDDSKIFSNCHSLRELPDISMIGTNKAAYYSSMNSNSLAACHSLNKVSNWPVRGNNYTSNGMGSIVSQCYRLADFTFETNEDGTPKTITWKSQTFDLTAFVGYVNNLYYILSYNNGITADKEVKDDATYQALKNDPDWYTTDVNYSRYNHDSAVATINSLPDCSATGTNTIKFMGAAGALTDGGAINTLTEAEIAVATAKGWVVSYV